MQHAPDSTGTINLKFKLIYKGSHHGCNRNAFHRQCDNQGPTLTVIKVKSTNEIIGGYNPLSWNKGGLPSYENTEHSFLFALRSGEDGGNILSVCKDYSKAIYNSSLYGPKFGSTDLRVFSEGVFFVGDFNIAKKGAYCTPIRQSDKTFGIHEIEVFQVKNSSCDNG
jgi:hypothetical protein